MSRSRTTARTAARADPSSSRSGAGVPGAETVRRRVGPAPGSGPTPGTPGTPSSDQVRTDPSMIWSATSSNTSNRGRVMCVTITRGCVRRSRSARGGPVVASAGAPVRGAGGSLVGSAGLGVLTGAVQAAATRSTVAVSRAVRARAVAMARR